MWTKHQLIRHFLFLGLERSGLFTPDSAFEVLVRKQVNKSKEALLKCVDLVTNEITLVVQKCAGKAVSYSFINTINFFWTGCRLGPNPLPSSPTIFPLHLPAFSCLIADAWTQHRIVYSGYGFWGYSQRADCQVKGAMLEMRGHGRDGAHQRRSPRDGKRGTSSPSHLIQITVHHFNYPLCFLTLSLVTANRCMFLTHGVAIWTHLSTYARCMTLSSIFKGLKGCLIGGSQADHCWDYMWLKVTWRMYRSVVLFLENIW